MKKSLFLSVVFIIFLFALTLFGGIAFMLYDDCIQLSAGSEISFFNSQSFLLGLIFSIPFAAVASLFFVVFYIIRHPSNPWFNLLVYSILGLLVWLLIIPLSYRLADLMPTQMVEHNYAKNFFTEDYFRKVPEGYVYFSKVHDNKTADGVLIVRGNPKTFEDIPLVSFFDELTYDPLFESEINPPGLIVKVISFFKLFWSIGKYSYMGMGLYLVSLLSFAFALLSVIGLSRCSGWRLCNISYVFIAFIFICFVNNQIYASKFFVNIIGFFIERNIDFLSDRRGLQIIFNSIVFITCTTIGIVNIIKNPDANQEITE